MAIATFFRNTRRRPVGRSLPNSAATTLKLPMLALRVMPEISTLWATRLEPPPAVRIAISRCESRVPGSKSVPRAAITRCQRENSPGTPPFSNGRNLPVIMGMWYKGQQYPGNFLALAFQRVGVPARQVDLEEILEFHQFCSPRDQLQDRVLRRRVGRQDHESAAHLPENRGTTEGQDDLARHRDRANVVLRLPAARSGIGARVQDPYPPLHRPRPSVL